MKQTSFAVALTLASWAFSLDLSAAGDPSLVASASETVKLPVYRTKGGGWTRGYRPAQIVAWECTARNALLTDSLKVVGSDGCALHAGVDYTVEPTWGSVGLCGKASARTNETFTVSYSYRLQRIDSRIRANGQESVRRGVPHVYMPEPPELKPGEELLENVLVTTDGEERFPLTETAAQARRTSAGAEGLTPKTLAKLLGGEPVTILAWGDSVTACGFLPKKDYWQEQFVRRLRERFPKSEITLVSNGWGGRTTRSFLNEPEGSKFNYTNTVLNVKADLVVSEFVNDCGLTDEMLNEIYPRLLREFRAAGKEWIVLTPHYVRGDWMGLTAQTWCDTDPRRYVKFLRTFAWQNKVGLADASLRWGHLWREGIPYETLFVNNINHPNAKGMSFFADALMDFFGAATCSRVKADVSALPEDWRLVGGLLRERIEARTAPSDAKETLKVVYKVDTSVPGENAKVTVDGTTATVRASRLRGFLFGTGNLLKAIRYGAQSFRITNGTWDFTPAKSLRIAYFARHLLNWYMESPADELCRYIDDLALDGINAFLFQFSIPEVDAGREGPEETVRFETVSRQMSDRITALDCDFCEWGGSNQLKANAPEKFRGVPNTDRKRGNLGFNACPEIPGALDAMLALRRDNLKKLDGTRVGYLCHWSFDEGGCECKKCYPWGGNGMLKLIEKLHEVNRAAHPEAKTIVSTWYFHEDDYDGLWKYLETHDWIDYVLADDNGMRYPTYPLKHKLPGKAKLITFPEISMWGRGPWGGDGATALPHHLEGLFRQSEAVSDGFMYYSEGNYEDINKTIVTDLYVTPTATTDDILRRYGSYHFAGTNPNDFVRLANLFELNHRVVGMSAEVGAAEKAIAEKMDKAILPGLRKSWRWRLVYVRAHADEIIARTGDVHSKELYPYFDELCGIYHSARQRKAKAAGIHRGWTSPRYDK